MNRSALEHRRSRIVACLGDGAVLYKEGTRYGMRLDALSEG